MKIIGTNIISSLGFTTEENFNTVKSGISGVKHYDVGTFDLPEAFMASLIDKEKLNNKFAVFCGRSPIHWEWSKYLCTDLEQAAMLSIFYANLEAKIDLSSERTIFILSTTKGNIDLIDNEQLAMNNKKNCSLYLWHSAKKITDFFQNPNTPIVVSNACISGAAAQITAMRELETGNYDNAVVVGVDFLSKFIISGFQSFKALSPELCKPFDKSRIGLNLGEAAATIIFEGVKEVKELKGVSLVAGAIRNDANHISAPSKTGEGSYRALKNILTSNFQLPTSELSFINAHGTSTPYNDAMEVQAINRAGLENVPVNSLKAVFGHTLGAAGVLESIISIKALQENLVLKSLNFNEQDFENQINISQKLEVRSQELEERMFIKMMSGFGGVNAVLLFGYPQITQINAEKIICKNLCNLRTKKHISLSFKNSEEITEFYRSLQVDYPKFFKMDILSKLGFLASEMIFKDDENRFQPREDIAVICFNRSSSLEIDTQYQATIQNNENYFPSPSLFVYTLPNIVTGEIAIRNKFFGETSFYVLENYDEKEIFRITRNTLADSNLTSALVAWVEGFEVKMFLVTKSET